MRLTLYTGLFQEVGKPIFKGDPYGAAAEAGVKPGMVVKAVNGKDVTKEDFFQIMTLIKDKSLGNGEKMKPLLPLGGGNLQITFAELGA